jgi:hypothetical protein
MKNTEEKHYKGTKKVLDGYHAISKSLSSIRFRDYRFYFLIITMVFVGGYWGLRSNLRKPAEAVASSTVDIGNIVKNSMQEIRTELQEIPKTIEGGFKTAENNIRGIESDLMAKIDSVVKYIKWTCCLLGTCAIVSCVLLRFYLAK